ncbi:hypothetical protein C0J52_20978 [Blattella germanica]|nr:hypothetical protein C0J52_20978 [Blattella germanica]
MEAKISKEKYIRKSLPKKNQKPIANKVKLNVKHKIIPGSISGIIRPLNFPMEKNTNIPGLIQIASWEKCLLKSPTVSIIRPEYETTQHILPYIPEIDIRSGLEISTVEEEILTDVPIGNESEHTKENNDDQNIITHRRFDTMAKDKNAPFKVLKYYRENSLDYDKRKFTPQYKLVARMNVETEVAETNTSTSSPATSSSSGKSRTRPISHQLHLLPRPQSQESDDPDNISKSSNSKFLSGDSKLSHGTGLSYSSSYSSSRSGVSFSRHSSSKSSIEK